MFGGLGRVGISGLQGSGRGLPYDIVRMKSIALSPKYLTRQSHLLRTSPSASGMPFVASARPTCFPSFRKSLSQTSLHQLSSTQGVSGSFWRFFQARLTAAEIRPNLHDDKAVPCLLWLAIDVSCLSLTARVYRQQPSQRR